jgi:hypothetical protein
MRSLSARRRGFREGFALATCLATAAVAVGSTPGAQRARSQAPLPSFACYEGTFSAFRGSTVTLSDRFGGRSRTAVGAAVALCAAAGVNGRAIGDQRSHLTCHGIDRRVPVRPSARARNLLGTLTATLVRSQSLCTPASTAAGGTLGDPPDNLDDFACYAVRARASTRKVTVADEFGRTNDVVGAPIAVCAPASVNGSKTVQRRVLACYRLTSETQARPRIVRNRFALMRASPGRRGQLCLPSIG